MSFIKSSFAKSLKSALVAAALLASGAANAAFISFTGAINNTTYLSSGLLLGSNTGSYTVGGCGNLTPGSTGCLGNGGAGMFSGELTFTFVQPNSMVQSSVGSFQMILCEGCEFRGTSAKVFDAAGGLLTTINMNTNAGAGNRTFNFASANIGRIVVDLGSRADAVQSLNFAAAQVPEPGSIALLGLGLAGLAFSRKRKAARAAK